MIDPLARDRAEVENRIGAWLRQVAGEWERELIAYGCITITLDRSGTYRCSLGFAIFRGGVKPFQDKLSTGSSGYLVYAIRERGNAIGLNLVMLVSDLVRLRVYDCGRSMCYAYTAINEGERVSKDLGSMIQQLRRRGFIYVIPSRRATAVKLVHYVVNSLVEVVSITEPGKCPCEVGRHA